MSAVKLLCDRKSLCFGLTVHGLNPEPNSKGISLVQVANVNTGKLRMAGVAFKRTERDKGIFFNFCPFCGKALHPIFARKTSK